MESEQQPYESSGTHSSTAGSQSQVPFLMGLVGLVLGAVAGAVLFVFAIRQGFYMLAFPGAAVGLGAGGLSKIRSPLLAGISALVATVLLLLLEWRYRPFIADDSLPYFLTHLHQLQPMTLFMILLGIVFAGWFGYGRERLAR